MKIFLNLLFFLTIVTVAYADNDVCPGDLLSSLDQVSTDKSLTDDHTVEDGDIDIYHFTVAQDGTIDISTTPASHYNADYALSVGVGSCGTWNKFSQSGQNNYTVPTFNVTAGDTISIKFEADRDNFLHFPSTRSNYQFTISYTASAAALPIVDNADDICYEEVQSSGTFCVDMGMCSGGLNCSNAYPIKNLSQDDLENVVVYYNEDNMAGGSFGSSCDVEPSGSCSSTSNVNLGPVGAFGKATKFTFANNIAPDNNSSTTNVSSTNFASASCMGSDELYATYVKDGKRYRGKMKQCVDVSYPCSKPHEFKVRKKVVLPGDLIAIGNSSICADNDKDGVCDSNQRKRNDVDNIIFINSSSSSAVAGEPSTLENVSGARLNIPQGARVVWAGLYWQGEVWDIKTANDTKEDQEGSENGTKGQERKAKADTVKFKVPGGTYQTLKADSHSYLFLKRAIPGKKRYKKAGFQYTGIMRYEEHYQGFKDVTALVQQGGNGEYWVGDIQATPGKLWFPGVEAAWNLEVIYELPGTNPRSISVSDGYIALYSNASSGDAYAKEVGCPTGSSNTGVYDQMVDFDISGFLTPKEPGFTTDMTIFITESDPDRTVTAGQPERLSLTKKDGSVSKIDGDDAWNYEIKDKNGSDNLERTPAYIYPIGMTIKNYKVTNALDPEQTKTHVTFQTDSDKLMLGVIGFATDLRKPKLCYDYAYSQYGRYFTEDYNSTRGPAITDDKLYIDPNEDIAVKLYVKNMENSDIIAKAMEIQILDINTSQAKYDRQTTKVTYPDEMTPQSISDSQMSVADAHIKHIPIGNVDALDFLYVYYSLDPTSRAHFIPINARVDYNITLDTGDENITIPYQVYLDEDIDICSGGNTYKPAPGIFNIVHANYQNTSLSSNYYYNLPTQVVRREGKFKLLSMDPTNLDVLKGASTIVSVEMIDVAAFHDTNASCLEQLSAITKRVWMLFENNATIIDFDKNALQDAINNQRTALGSTKEFFAQARENVAFRLSYNAADKDGNLLQVQGGSGGYSIVNWNHAWDGESCGDGTGRVSNHCQANGNTQAKLAECMECLFGKNTKVMCSRDNFAIRPEAFLFKISDTNTTTNSTSTLALSNSLSAGVLDLGADYNYTVSATATSNDGDTPALGYSRYFSKNSGDLFGYKWSPNSSVSNCNDTTDKRIKAHFYDGVVSLTDAVAQVGEYKLGANDTFWTRVDGDTSYMGHHQGAFFLPSSQTDCITSSNIVQSVVYNPNAHAPLIGCTISSEHNNSVAAKHYKDIPVVFHPYSFDINQTFSVGINPDGSASVAPLGGANPYVYMSNMSSDENMSLHVNLTLTARGKNSSNGLSNFVDGCYAKPISVEIDKTKAQQSGLSYVSKTHNINPAGAIVSSDNIDKTIATPNDDNLSLALTTRYFMQSAQGVSRSRINLNYNRDTTTLKNPEKITINTLVAADRATTFSADMQSGKKAIKTQTINQPLVHYFAKAHTPKTTIAGQDGDAPIYYEVYCYESGCDKTLLQDGTASNNSDDPRWWINSKHTKKFGWAKTIEQKRTPRHVSVTTASSGNAPDKVSLHYDATRGYPYRAIMKLIPHNWLIYNKYDPNAVHNEFEVEFNKDGSKWIGSGETSTSTKTKSRAYKDRKLTW